MEKTYFIYDVKKAVNEGASKAFLSTEGGGGSFLFTDQIKSPKPIKESENGNIKIVKEYSDTELIKMIAGIEEARSRKNNFNHFQSDEESAPVESSLAGISIVKKRISEVREQYQDHDVAVAEVYDRSEVIDTGDNVKAKKQRASRSLKPNQFK